MKNQIILGILIWAFVFCIAIFFGIGLSVLISPLLLQLYWSMVIGASIVLLIIGILASISLGDMKFVLAAGGLFTFGYEGMIFAFINGATFYFILSLVCGVLFFIAGFVLEENQKLFNGCVLGSFFLCIPGYVLGYVFGGILGLLSLINAIGALISYSTYTTLTASKEKARRMLINFAVSLVVLIIFTYILYSRSSAVPPVASVILPLMYFIIALLLILTIFAAIRYGYLSRQAPNNNPATAKD